MSVTVVELKKCQCDLCGVIIKMEVPKNANPLRDCPDGWVSFPPSLAGQKHVCDVCADDISRKRSIAYYQTEEAKTHKYKCHIDEACGQEESVVFVGQIP